MKRWKVCVAAALASLPAVAAANGIYRCTAPDGAVTYQETACLFAREERPLAIPTEFPPVNAAERNRLLQREAALDARMLKRAELETAERIARDARRTRELELAAERERSRQAEQPVFVVPWLPHPRPHPRPRLRLRSITQPAYH